MVSQTSRIRRHHLQLIEVEDPAVVIPVHVLALVLDVPVPVPAVVDSFQNYE